MKYDDEMILFKKHETTQRLEGKSKSLETDTPSHRDDGKSKSVESSANLCAEGVLKV
jgi:hypothetical protein